MSNEHAHESSVATYVIVALVLGVITYVEFAIVEYEIAWLSNFWILFWLVLLSVLKFILVIMFFMHLKDDDNLYTGFFGSGLLFALGTFVALGVLFALPPALRFLRADADAVPAQAEVADAHAEVHGISDELRALIASGGYSRPTAEVLDTPPPRDLRVRFGLPAVPAEADYTLTEAPALFAQAPAEEAAEPAAEEAAAPDDVAVAFAWDEELGGDVYASNCSACHQATGQGVPGVFPPLAGHMPVLYSAEGGREYLVNVMLYGLQGSIEVDGQTYNGLMPAWAQLSNEQIAAVLNHELTDWGNLELLEDFEPITADEVEEQRGEDLSMQEVLELRHELDLDAAAEAEQETAEAEQPAGEQAEEPAEEVEESAAAPPADAPTEEAEEAATEPEPAQEEALEAAGEAAPTIAWDEELGGDVYASNCSACHQATGQGVPGVFPPLAGHMPVLYSAEGGREYLVNVMLYGLQGSIEVDGQTYNGLMPAWAQLSNEQIAAVLNHELTDWGNLELLEDFEPITADEVEEQRDLGLSTQDVLEQRMELPLP